MRNDTWDDSYLNILHAANVYVKSLMNDIKRSSLILFYSWWTFFCWLLLFISLEISWRVAHEKKMNDFNQIVSFTTHLVYSVLRHFVPFFVARDLEWFSNAYTVYASFIKRQQFADNLPNWLGDAHWCELECILAYQKRYKLFLKTLLSIWVFLYNTRTIRWRTRTWYVFQTFLANFRRQHK